MRHAGHTYQCRPFEAINEIHAKSLNVMAMNLRELRHFFGLRTSDAAHPQMREIAIPLLEEFKKRVKIIFDDINTA